MLWNGSKFGRGTLGDIQAMGWLLWVSCLYYEVVR